MGKFEGQKAKSATTTLGLYSYLHSISGDLWRWSRSDQRKGELILSAQTKQAEEERPKGEAEWRRRNGFNTHTHALVLDHSLRSLGTVK